MCAEENNEKSVKYSDMVYEMLKNDILGRRFEPKDKLSETTLAKLYNVSRTPVREALHKLEKEGLVVKLSDGYHVSFLTKEQILKIFEVRAVLEALAAEKAAENRDPAMLSKLREAAENFKKADRSNPLALAQANSYFHDIIADMSGNEYLRDILKDLRNKLAIVRVDLFASSNRVEQEIEEHWRIYEAIEKGDPKEAHDAALKHQMNLIEFIKSKRMVGGILV
ncbi:Transcriptional regulator [Acidilobus saccharovorans 345-15]|uniref:Transcriptional regulator n=1 Tax=Acidilobus saccharovorans (strain DSM 16705 / JCM 18335 / VKM B-2471 / 345-15) TaxID=666510 RepID=D9Q028_ACIS3|nr:GntR family transcriptional regulator [Acidilobus saccharovorans]ADL18666.1 Transcriptional regulator [Acidilobus saccharovorans 345-15]